MTRFSAVLLVVTLFFSSPVYAGDDTKLADVASWTTVLANIAFDTANSYRSLDKKDAFKKQGLRLGLTIGSSELIKLFVHKTRPDKSDDKSFWSEHSAVAAASQGYNYYIGGSLTFGTMAGRVEAQKHYKLDVGVGAAVGTLFGLIR